MVIEQVLDPAKKADEMLKKGLSGWSLVNDSCNMRLIREIMNPAPGDLVFESTNPFEDCLKCVGELLSVMKLEGGINAYKILLFDGTEQEWVNAKFVKIINEETKKT